MSAVTSLTVRSKETGGGLTLITAGISFVLAHVFNLAFLSESFGIAKEELVTIWLVRTTCFLTFVTTAVILPRRLTVERGI